MFTPCIHADILPLAGVLPIDWGASSTQSWLLLAILVALVIGLVQRQVQARRLADLDEKLDALEDLAALDQLDFLEHLEPLEARVARIASNQVQFDSRPLERTLTDIRDGQRRVEMRLVSVIESLDLTREAVSIPMPIEEIHVGVLADRVTDRLLALGYDRIEFITSPEELELAGEDGEIRIEARRDGAPHKGRVVVRDGKIADVLLRSSYEIFP